MSEFKNTLLLQAENALLVQHIKITGKTLDAEMHAEARGKSADRGALKCWNMHAWLNESLETTADWETSQKRRSGIRKLTLTSYVRIRAVNLTC